MLRAATGQTSPHRLRLVVSHSTCPPLSFSPSRAQLSTRSCSTEHQRECLSNLRWAHSGLLVLLLLSFAVRFCLMIGPDASELPSLVDRRGRGGGPERESDESRAVAFAMVTHDRLGKQSKASGLSCELVDGILRACTILKLCI